MTTIDVKGSTYHVDYKLEFLWNKNTLQKMKKRNTDRVYIVDGRERSGKSTFAIQQMGFLDPEAFSSPKEFVSRICFSPEQFNEACRNTENGVIVFDEAFRGLSSRAALSKTNKMIIQTLMEMGQRNNIVFIVLPSVFMLDTYPAILRSDGLFHISEDSRTSRRKFEGFSRSAKNKIYKEGAKKGWNYNQKTRFNGRFGAKFPGGEEYQQAYLKKKLDTFRGTDAAKLIEEEDKNYLHKCIFAYKWLEGMKKPGKRKYKKMSEIILKEFKQDIPERTMEYLCYRGRKLSKENKLEDSSENS